MRLFWVLPEDDSSRRLSVSGGVPCRAMRVLNPGFTFQ